jgi:hypothetical protein
MALPRRKQDPVTLDPEPNDDLVKRIEEWLPGLEAPLTWVRSVNFEIPDGSEPVAPEPTELRRY